MQRVLPPIGNVPPHITSRYGEVQDRPPGSSKPHRGVDFNYVGGRDARLNRSHPALRSPVAGIVIDAGQDTVGRIAIRARTRARLVEPRRRRARPDGDLLRGAGAGGEFQPGDPVCRSGVCVSFPRMILIGSPHGLPSRFSRVAARTAHEIPLFLSVAFAQLHPAVAFLPQAGLCFAQRLDGGDARF